jgi:hypothetical protein
MFSHACGRTGVVLFVLAGTSVGVLVVVLLIAAAMTDDGNDGCTKES